MVDKLAKITKWIGYILMILSVIAVATVFINGGTDVAMALDFGYVMIILALLAMLLSPICSIIVDPKSVKGIGVAAGCAVVVALIAYLLAKGVDTLSAEYLESMGVTEGVDFFSGFCVEFLYIMFVGVVLALVFSFIFKLIRK